MLFHLINFTALHFRIKTSFLYQKTPRYQLQSYFFIDIYQANFWVILQFNFVLTLQEEMKDFLYLPNISFLIATSDQ